MKPTPLSCRSPFHATRRPLAHAVALALPALLMVPPAGAQDPANAAPAPLLAPVEVVGTTPLAGSGVPRERLPVNAVVLDERALSTTGGSHVADRLLRAAPAVTVNEVQGNPFQMDVNYRGFSASPLLGTAQGLSIFLDGVRVNEPFGDTVNWDLIPRNALTGVELMPGSSPAFGLNTLGGALALHTKDGFSHPLGAAEISGGSFGRSDTGFELGGNNGVLGGYVAGNWFREDGWRDHSPTDVRQGFGKLSLRHDALEADFSLLRARTRLVGNGLVPESMLDDRRAAIFTHPDETRNDLTQVSFSGRYRLTAQQSLAANAYYRRTTTRTLNGDANDEYEDDWDNGVPDHTGAYHRTRTRQVASGVAGQWSLATNTHRLAAGASFDRAGVRFRQTQALGYLNGSRGVSRLDETEVDNELSGSTHTASLYITDTWSILPTVHLTAAARYNDSRVILHDELNPHPPNLDGDHRYRSLNPALGLSWDIAPALNAYAGFSQGTRVPTPIELGCADPANPCSLPNAMAADPHLDQVVARTVEAGLRGRLNDTPLGEVRWNAGVFYTDTRDDILFVGTSTSAGYFTNFGKTRRQGVELAGQGKLRTLEWSFAYNWLRATFQSAACLLAENNSTRGTDPACTAGGQDDEIRVGKGDRLPGLPEHSLKLGLGWRPLGWLRLGGDVQAFSGVYVRGNENNRHQSGRTTDAFGGSRDFEGRGRLPGYAVLNLNAEATLPGGWQLFARVDNVFDKRYATAGALAENPFTGGRFQADPEDWRRETFVAPGAPRAGWVGVRYAFDVK